ncbi:RagB/SusD family nutrient uptake outer membrane protein [Chitinophaga sp. MM2321]|uniref:RagB/SusD family nutrient uptake outer membrane protein n=1 Tax=Chitinophaga sp. MM2321 TaxID=3137178 RepID=UPI0032D57CFC
MTTKYIAILIAAFMLTGCSLKEKIYDSAISDTFIKSENDALFQLNGVYSFFPTFNCFKSNLPYQIIDGGDDIAVTNSTKRLFNERTVSSSNIYFTSAWSSFFNTINNANALMETLEKTTPGILSESYKDRIMGELYFMRAFSYFYLVRLYGGVPLHTQSVQGNADFYPARNSVEEVYNLIFEDLKKATEKCIPYSQQPAKEFGHATKGAAQAILSLAYLTYANSLDLKGQSGDSKTYYQFAANYADSVIQSHEYFLISNYADLWNVDLEKNAHKEVIFSIQFTRDGTAASASSRGSELAYFLQPTTRFNICGNPTDGAGAGTTRLQPWFVQMYKEGQFANDYRSEVSFLTRWSYKGTAREAVAFPEITNANEIVEQYPYINKYIDPKGLQARNNENDFYVIRLSEVYLIKAEAENELNGPSSDAYTAFNMLRQRARLADGNQRTTPENLPAGLSKQEFRLAVFNERGLELVGEGHRWFDAVRMRYLDDKTTMVEYRYNKFYPTMTLKAPAYNATTHTWTGGLVQPLNVVSWSPKFLLWPIPSPEIDANPNMTQNTEYGW